jgi:hypothetical protein
VPAKTKPTDKAAELPVPNTPEGVRELLTRASKGDKATLPAVRKLLEDPANVERLGGNLARYAQGLLVKALSGEDLAVREAINAKLATMRKELLGENPTPVEVLLVERVVACWLQVQDAEIKLGHHGDMSIRQADFHQRRLDATNRRYLAALKALALVRKLAVPALQINVAKKQVNVVAPAAVTAAPAAKPALPPVAGPS